MTIIHGSGAKDSEIIIQLIRGHLPKTWWHIQKVTAYQISKAKFDLGGQRSSFYVSKTLLKIIVEITCMVCVFFILASEVKIDYLLSLF